MLISIFFVLATICSMIGFAESCKISNIDDNSDGDVIGHHVIDRKHHRIIWSSSITTFGRVVHFFFEVCGGITFYNYFIFKCAFVFTMCMYNQFLNTEHKNKIGTAVLITLVTFTVLNPRFSFWNVSQHFITLMVLVLELFLNNMYVRIDHFPFNLSWALLYLIFIWPMVVTNKIPFWPYFFLATNNHSCFLNYTVLIVADFLFYCIFYSLSRLKCYVRNIVELRKPSHTVYI